MAKNYGTAAPAGYSSDDASANHKNGNNATTTNSHGHKHDKNNPRRRVVIGPQNNISDSVSELSHDDTASVSSGFSKSSAAFRARFAPSRFGRKKKKKKRKEKENGSEDDHGSEGGGSGQAASASVSASDAANRVRFQAPQDAPSAADTTAPSTPSSGTKSSRGNRHASDVERLRKDAKSRYNIGLIYLKTGDYHKAQENLEHSLYCHIQLAGHETSLYDNQSILRIAAVREKLGDCYYANTAVVDKCLALDHYEEAKRLLKGVHEEDAEEELLEMLERVEEKLGQEGLCRGEELRRLPSVHPPPGSRYDAKGRGGVGGVGAAGAAGAGAAGAAGAGLGIGMAATAPAATNAVTAAEATPAALAGFAHLGKVTHKIHKGIGKFTNDFIDTVDAAFDGVIDGDLFHPRANNIASAVRSSLKGSENSEVNAFGLSMVHLERENHRTALNQLDEVHSSAALMADPNVRLQMIEHLMRIGDAAYEAQKFAVATDAYEKIFSIYYEEQKDIDVDGGRTLQLAVKGCIRCHKKLALEDERKDEYLKAIHHRNRIYQLLDMNKRTMPACQQLVMIAFLHGQLEQYKESADVLSDAIRRLFQGVQSFDLMPKDRISLLIRCYHMRAICYAKQQLWNKAFEQYDEALPLIAREEGMNSRDYNSALIHKSALLVTTGDYATALTTVNQYFKNVKDSLTVRQGQQLVDDADHIMALDTLAAAHLKLGNADKAIEAFEKKLAFVDYVPKNDELKSATMHKLGCLLAYKKRHAEALPLLTGALDKRKYLYDTKSKFLFESSWAVAATSHSLGNSATALKEYGSLLEKINKIDDLPVDSVVIHNSAGKLFFDDGKIDKAIKAFQEALKSSQSSQNMSSSLKADIRLNLANALSAKGDIVASLKMYDEVLAMDSIQGTKEYYLTLYNQSLTVLKDGDLEETKLLLGDIIASRSKSAKGVKGNAFFTLGNIALSEGNTNDALQHFESALKIFSNDPEELASATQVKKSMAMTYASLGLYDDAISTLEEAVEKLSQPNVEGKTFHLLKADLWSSMSRVHQQRGDIAAAKNFSKLALQNYKDSALGYGENHPITLRNTSNLAVILLREAEGLPKDKSKPIIDAAKFEMEDALQKFIALNDMWTYRLDVASLKTNLGFVAVWQGKPKKARKLLRQIQEIEVPETHPLVRRIGILEQRVEKLEKAKSK